MYSTLKLWKVYPLEMFLELASVNAYGALRALMFVERLELRGEFIEAPSTLMFMEVVKRRLRVQRCIMPGLRPDSIPKSYWDASLSCCSQGTLGRPNCLFSTGLKYYI